MAEIETPQGETVTSTEIEEQDSTPETDWKAEARKWESRAKENLKNARANEDAAKRLAELEEAQKTEAERVAERLAAAEKRAEELEAKAVRAEIAAAKGIPLAVLEAGTPEELADAVLEFKAEQAKGPVIPSQTRAPEKASTGTAGSFARFVEGALSR